MELERIVASGLTNIYSLSTVQKEFRNSVNETWKDEEPYPRYQKKLLQDLAVLEDLKEEAITLPQFEKQAWQDGKKVRLPSSSSQSSWFFSRCSTGWSAMRCRC